MKILSLIFAVLLVSIVSQAETESISAPQASYQHEEYHPKHFILEVGYTSSQSTDPEWSDAKAGVSGGLLFDVYGEGYFTFETGAFITQQNFSYSIGKKDDGTSMVTDVDGTDVTGFTDLRVSGKVTYIGVPLFAKINLSGRRSNTAFLIGGAMPQFLVAKDMAVQGIDTAEKSQSYKPATNQFDPPAYDVTGVAGIGASYQVSEEKTLLIQATYNRGFIPVSYEGAGTSFYNQSFLVTVGFGVDL